MYAGGRPAISISVVSVSISSSISTSISMFISIMISISSNIISIIIIITTIMLVMMVLPGFSSNYHMRKLLGWMRLGWLKIH